MSGLVSGLRQRGIASMIAAPSAEAASYEHGEVSVHRFPIDPRPSLERAYGVADAFAAEGFRRIVDAVRPAIVHLHARTSAVSERLIDIAHGRGAQVVFTYHTPTVSCARGTMMCYGETPCDGLIEPRRCTACTLAARGLPTPIARLAADIPARLIDCANAVNWDARPLTALRIAGLIASGGRCFQTFMCKVDHVVAVCQWVRDVLERNGVPPQKITLSRQGVANRNNTAHRPTARSGEPCPLRIAFFGRIDPTKGADVLVEALRLVPEVNVRVDIYAVEQPGAKAVLAKQFLDERIHVWPALAPDDVIERMAQYDLIAVPSRWLETGPLVVLEAFAAGTPVLGSDLGGIAELVRDDVDGILIEPGNATSWAKQMGRLAANREIVTRLRANIMPPRTMDACAEDMAALYGDLIKRRATRVI